eukprot:534745_1
MASQNETQPSSSDQQYETPEARKEEFRKYLEKNGVVDAITKVLVGLYDEPERPPNVVDYVKRYIGAPTGVDVDAMRLHNNELKQENEELKMRIKHLQQKVDESDNLLQVK